VAAQVGGCTPPRAPPAAHASRAAFPPLHMPRGVRPPPHTPPAAEPPLPPPPPRVPRQSPLQPSGWPLLPPPPGRLVACLGLSLRSLSHYPRGQVFLKKPASEARRQASEQNMALGISEGDRADRRDTRCCRGRAWARGAKARAPRDGSGRCRLLSAPRTHRLGGDHLRRYCGPLARHNESEQSTAAHHARAHV
jgi:hypothetical protein